MNVHQKQRIFVYLGLIATLGFIAAAPLFSFIHGRMMLWLIGFCLFLALAAYLLRSKFDAIFILILALDFLLFWLVFGSGGAAFDQRTLAIRTLSITAFVLLNLVLLIGPWARFTRTIEKILKYRRHMGVTVFLLGLGHFRLVFEAYFDSSFAATFQSLFTFYGFTALFVMFFMAITSSDWVQKHITNQQWKIFHALTLLLYLPIVISVIWLNYSQNIPIETGFYFAIGAIIIYWIIVAPWGLVPRFMRYVKGWKQFHLLVYTTYFALILHSWPPVTKLNSLFLQVLWIILPAFVVGSHAVGWLIKWQQDKALREAEKQAESIKIDNIEYRSVGMVENFKEGIGRRVLVAGVPVAVFKQKDQFYAWYAVCPHQKGPLERGKIVKGYLTCPWHQWQFNTVDGCAPPGYGDCTNLYMTLVRDGKVFVSRIPRKKRR